VIDYKQWHALGVLIICGTFIGCSSQADKKDEPIAVDTGAATLAKGASGATEGSAPVYEGAVDSITCAAVSGWEWNRANGAEKINIDILVDNKLAGTTATNLPRPDLKDLTGSPNPNYGFSWAIPPELKDSKPHVVSAKISGGTQEVQVWEQIKPSFTCSAS
jgi:hypothetical protein